MIIDITNPECDPLEIYEKFKSVYKGINCNFTVHGLIWWLNRDIGADRPSFQEQADLILLTWEALGLIEKDTKSVTKTFWNFVK